MDVENLISYKVIIKLLQLNLFLNFNNLAIIFVLSDQFN